MHIPKLNDIPKPAGHYSPCVIHNGVLYLSGQLPIDFSTGKVPEGMAAQTALVFENIQSILLAAGSDKSKVLQARIYIPDVEYWPVVNEVYGDFFGDHKPARAIVPTRDLHYGALIEVEVIAAQ